MNITIRQEEAGDYQAVFDLIKEAFQNSEYTDNKEHFLVEKLRRSASFVPELSLIAEIDNKIAGHILLTRIKINNEQHQSDSLALAPVSVLPRYQKQGIGGRLIEHAHEKARELGFKSVVVLGHETYYPKFGYERADKFGIELPFDVPKENCMVVELTEDGLNGVQGTVVYAKEFYG